MGTEGQIVLGPFQAPRRCLVSGALQSSVPPLHMGRTGPKLSELHKLATTEQAVYR